MIKTIVKDSRRTTFLGRLELGKAGNICSAPCGHSTHLHHGIIIIFFLGGREGRISTITKSSKEHVRWRGTCVWQVLHEMMTEDIKGSNNAARFKK